MTAARQRHVPVRTCVGCRQPQAKRDLVRVVRAPSGEIGLDPTGKAAGRGAYLCRKPECWTAALRRGVLAGALRTTLGAEDRAVLERERDRLAESAVAPNHG